MTAFTTAFELWAAAPAGQDFHELIHDSLERLRTAVGRPGE